MSHLFRWNPYADQPHNVAPRRERLRFHFKHSRSYVSLALSNLQYAVPVLGRYREHWKKMYKEPVDIQSPFALSVSPEKGRNEEVVELLWESGVRKTLFRIPSWEKENLETYDEFFDLLHKKGIELGIALLQRRDDVMNPLQWKDFIEEVFSRFRKFSSFYEIGHAWNRTKWGVWDYKEYIELAYPAISLKEKYRVIIVGPAVIDFEFHLYPAVLNNISFDKISSLLYVDRSGAPENVQFGWSASRKIALLKAIVDVCGGKEVPLWITEVNWPLLGTGKYSPAAGRPNVSEEKQADYLVRYYILCMASGFVERIYWWQMIAPGYGLIDSRGNKWRKRHSFYALKTMIEHLEGSVFIGKIQHPQAFMFSFRKKRDFFIVCWTNREPCDYVFSDRVLRVLDRNGKEVSCFNNLIRIESSPKYVYF
ncbi:hypothetical protein ACFLRM_01550 [Acidobacteriota bacterium]